MPLAPTTKAQQFKPVPTVRAFSRAAQGSYSGTNGLHGNRKAAGAPTVAVIKKAHV